MKILALVTDAYGGYGGIAQYNRDFLSAVAAVPFVEHVAVIPRHAPDPITTLPAKLHQSDSIRSRVRYVLAAIAAVRRLKPDVIVSGHLYHGALAAALAKLSGAKLVVQLHGTEIWNPIRPQDRKPLAMADLVLTVSRDTLQRLKDQVAAARHNGIVLANSVRPDFTPGDRAAARASFKLSTTTQVLLSVSRLDERERYKGHDRIIAVLPALRAEGRDLLYLIAGDGSDRERLLRLADVHNVGDMIRFVGRVPSEQLVDLYRAADLFALPSTGEGFGIVYLEAMACGTPALGLSVGGAPDALGDGELGWCVESDELGDALRRALDAPRPDPIELHDKVVARFGQQAFRSHVEELFGGLKATASLP